MCLLIVETTQRTTIINKIINCVKLNLSSFDVNNMEIVLVSKISFALLLLLML